MPAKQYKLDGELNVKIYKRKGNRNLRLTVSPNGDIRVTIPSWAPYRAGYEFAKNRLDWVKQQHKIPVHLIHGQAVGKAHHLELISTPSAAKVSTRLSTTTIAVRYPVDFSESHPQVQVAAQKASIKALRSQAETLLPQRLANLARIHDFTYKSVTIKRLKGRWGSCDSHTNIVLNLFLMQLPWELIDYVLYHELTHTRILKHGPEFWAAMENVSPTAKILKKQLRSYQPVLDGLG